MKTLLEAYHAKTDNYYILLLSLFVFLITTFAFTYPFYLFIQPASAEVLSLRWDMSSVIGEQGTRVYRCGSSAGPCPEPPIATLPPDVDTYPLGDISQEGRHCWAVSSFRNSERRDSGIACTDITGLSGGPTGLIILRPNQ